MHPVLKDTEYWNLRFALLRLQEKVLTPDDHKVEVLNTIEELKTYLDKEDDPKEPW